MTCVMQTWTGAYVIDALEPDETERMRVHIADCAACQDEVVSLAWIPPLLRVVPLEAIERLDEGACPSPTMLERLLAVSGAERRTRRLRRPVSMLIAAAAAVAVGTAALVGSGAFSHHRPSPVAVHTVDPRTQVRAAVTLTGHDWGTEVHMTLSSVRPGERCALIVRSRDGRSEVAATWTASYGGTAEVPGATAIPRDQLSELDVVASDGRDLVRLVVPRRNR